MEPEKSELEKSLVREISSPIFNSRGWIKFLGIVMLVYGIFMALTIVGIIIAWLPIWIGILLIQAGSRIEQAKAIGNKIALVRSLESLGTYFTVYGVMALIGIIISVVMMIVVLSTGLLYNLQEYVPDYY